MSDHAIANDEFVLHGMVTRPDLNGVAVSLVDVLHNTGQVRVRSSSVGEFIDVLPSNLQRVSVVVAATTVGSNSYGHSEGCMCEGRFSAEICAAKRGVAAASPNASSHSVPSPQILSPRKQALPSPVKQTEVQSCIDARQRLMDRLEALDLPPNPLDEVIDRCAIDVA